MDNQRIQDAGSIVQGICWAGINSYAVVGVYNSWKGFDVETGNPVQIWIDTGNLHSHDTEDRLTGKNVIAFLQETKPSNLNDANLTAGIGPNDFIFHPMQPAANHLVEADADLIMILDMIVTQKPSDFTRQPLEFRRHAIQPNDGFLVPVRCCRTQKTYFYQVLNDARLGYVCAPNPVIRNYTKLREETTYAVSVFNKIQYRDEHAPACPYCGWTDAVECENCGAIHCIPRSGQTFMGNGVCLGEPTHTENIPIQCPSCGAKAMHEHHFYPVPENARNPKLHGDSLI